MPQKSLEGDSLDKPKERIYPIKPIELFECEAEEMRLYHVIHRCSILPPTELDVWKALITITAVEKSTGREDKEQRMWLRATPDKLDTIIINLLATYIILLKKSGKNWKDIKYNINSIGRVASKFAWDDIKAHSPYQFSMEKGPHDL